MKHKRFFPRLTSLLCTLAMSLSLVPAVSAASQPEPLISTNRYGYYNGMSAHRILGLYSVPRVWLFAN